MGMGSLRGAPTLAACLLLAASCTNDFDSFSFRATGGQGGGGAGTGGATGGAAGSAGAGTGGAAGSAGTSTGGVAGSGGTGAIGGTGGAGSCSPACSGATPICCDKGGGPKCYQNAQDCPCTSPSPGGCDLAFPVCCDLKDGKGLRCRDNADKCSCTPQNAAQECLAPFTTCCAKGPDSETFCYESSAGCH